MTSDDLLQLVPKLNTKKDREDGSLFSKETCVLTDSKKEDARKFFQTGEEFYKRKVWIKMVRSIVKDKSEDFETPTQGKTLGEADISPEGLEAAETLAKVLTRKETKYLNKEKDGVVRNERKGMYKEQRERDRRNRPITQAEQREYMIKYLKSQDESVKREEEVKVEQPILRYNIRKSLARKGLQKNKSESARSDTEEDVEAYMDERVDEPSSRGVSEMGSSHKDPPAKIIKWQILKTRKKRLHTIYMLTEVKYPLPSRVCQAMLEKRLIGDRKDEVKLVTSPPGRCNVSTKGLANPRANGVNILGSDENRLKLYDLILDAAKIKQYDIKELLIEIKKLSYTIEQLSIADSKIIPKDNAHNITQELIIRNSKKLEVHKEKNKLGDDC
ncbi:hypothetical protein Tco_1119095 [Tanacetum coccineum]